jgi:NAD(P)-dependent dehydrogenase (short-subunit alcohol dehydrogenase family)
MKNTILVSGAGSGIGRAITKALAEEGYPVLLLGRRQDALEETLSTLGEPAKHKIIVADMRDAGAIKAGLKEIAPVLHGVVANAGLGGENHYGEGDRWGEIVETNLTGTYQLVREALPYFASKDAGYRQIVIVSSILARLGVPGYSAYCASKAGLLGLMRSWAVEFAAEKILVNAVAPGWVSTEMATQGLETFAESAGKTYDEIYAEQMADVPLGKMSTPAEVAELVKFMLAQTSMTGQTIDFNNGAIMPA